MERCNQIWLESQGVVCQLESGHAGEHQSRCYTEGWPHNEFDLWWMGEANKPKENGDGPYRTR
jgi:hypothetical protein